ncbi:MAG: hypothetical protein UV56_C0030G0005 [Candidatus Woesebacteria bacterium GW2011_GWC1_43_10b]|uniref:Cell division protein FtsL n=1 Tax=Candidatus Woesebacteria bacterium GW2011_GWC1_43_10b TaxID=1618585 RepID=A0A0G1C2Z0_9BACT|nr:MAG: hypothetical protein UV56_C0030G0005 [Candidatus Woesebacteria bacterium GW2011_GWC1_43_10b]
MTILGQKIPFLVIVLLGVLMSAVVLVVIASSTKGARLLELEEEVGALERENRELTSKLVSNTSLLLVEEKSQELGMIKPENVVYLETQEQIAKLP